MFRSSADLPNWNSKERNLLISLRPDDGILSWAREQEEAVTV